MPENRKIDILIYGAGIAGLWTLARLKALGYDVLLLERETIGGGQSIASQGILHSGLKYALAGQVNDIAQSISAMPEIWRQALKGGEPVDLANAKVAASSQQLLIPDGIMSGITKLMTKKALGRSVREIPSSEWDDNIKASGFSGSIIDMNELVLDIPSVIKALAELYKDCIRKEEGQTIKAKKYIYTAADGSPCKEIQKRPLLMGMLKRAPFPLYAHLVGASEKPVATITTHEDKDGNLIWYIGGHVAERKKESPAQETITAAQDALKRYLPALDLSAVEWATLPVDRVEGKAKKNGWLPDTPVILEDGDTLYCWPSKLTFAPLLADMIIEKLDFDSSNRQTDFSDLPEVGYSDPPWDKAKWTKDKSDQAA